ncbi:hypothetical protein C8Q74DRAFT_1374606 [Fomes fomentarius]|nr:hypothetical protein C8Q74DRAFT_1374606 [Fomes fomentarius]
MVSERLRVGELYTTAMTSTTLHTSPANDDSSSTSRYQLPEHIRAQFKDLSPDSVLERAAVLMEKYQRNIDELQAQKREIAEMRNAAALIHIKLPTEILMQILRSVHPETPAGIRITHVSRLWHSLAQSIPEFWEDLLRNEKTHRLSALFDFYFPSLESLTIWLIPHSHSEILEDGISQARFPRLRSVLSNCTSIAQFCAAPTLRSLIVKDPSARGPTHQRCCFPTFTALHEILRECPNLEELQSPNVTYVLPEEASVDLPITSVDRVTIERDDASSLEGPIIRAYAGDQERLVVPGAIRDIAHAALGVAAVTTLEIHWETFHFRPSGVDWLFVLKEYAALRTLKIRWRHMQPLFTALAAEDTVAGLETLDVATEVEVHQAMCSTLEKHRLCRRNT